MNLTLKIWRQKNANDKGKMVDYQISDVSSKIIVEFHIFTF